MPEEKGKIISCGKIKVASPLRADGIVISTIGDEFNLKDISKIHGVIALDVQGFVRTRKGANLDFKGVLKNIAILKATRSELETLAPTDVRDQKKRILLITRGADGFEIFAEGQHYIFRNKKIAARDTIGAGDVLLTAFLVAFLRTNDSKLAGSFALDYVTKFIENKSNGQNKKHIQKG